MLVLLPIIVLDRELPSRDTSSSQPIWSNGRIIPLQGSGSGSIPDIGNLYSSMEEHRSSKPQIWVRSPVEVLLDIV